MIIRDATTDDIAQLLEFWNPIVRDTTVTFSTILKTHDSLSADMVARAAAGEAFVVAEDAGQVLGLATYFPFRSGPGYALTVEHTIVLSPAAHGRGVGRALMDRICEHAKARGVHVMVAGVSAENDAGLAFHRAIGFAEVGRMPETGRKFDRWIDLVLLQKIL